VAGRAGNSLNGSRASVTSSPTGVIHPSAEKKNSTNFALKEFSEVRDGLCRVVLTPVARFCKHTAL
jgi:hypothetical protein